MPQAVGFLGGTFDPVHNGHVVLATLAREALGLERLLLIPALRSPHKAAGAAAPPEARIAMLRHAFAGVPATFVSDLEIQRPPPSYTADTVVELARTYAGRELVMLLGLDALVDFPRWRDAAAIARTCRLAVFRRTGADLAEAAAVGRALPGVRIDLVGTPTIEISSTLVRERARAGLPLGGFVPDAVAAAIARLRLYAPD